ncbi:ABC transporter permease [Elioraea thermophila]|uniref:ABC transporter permease n=1 Tax=Elioraea thermophila TaxID=2185104 RepID=UPI000DF17A47|nr:ABC transporter permease [Elioraea thermophila]
MSAAPLAPPVSSMADPLATASGWRLFWLRFRRHRVAFVSLWIVVALYGVAAFAEFLAPHPPDRTMGRYTYAPPQPFGLFWTDPTTGETAFRPHVDGYRVEIDPVALRRSFVPDATRPVDVCLFPRVEPYRLWGVVPLEHRLFGPCDPNDPFFLFGADRLGRDVLSRTIHGTRISLSVGLIGVALSLLLGIAIGGAAGYVGGALDAAVQRVSEVLRSLPTIPLWLGLAAALPREWDPLTIYFAITVLLSLIGWIELARVVRGRFLALRGEDFVLAARIEGMHPVRVVMRHMVPQVTSHVIATATLAIPAMILAETALSFLGLGLQPPLVSWGVLLQEAQNIRSVAAAPWLFLPGGAVVLAVLCLNFLGDGLRDAADPYDV